MFTGLVSDVGEVVGAMDGNDIRRFRIACSYAAKSIAIGASIACSGPCLTVVEVGYASGRTTFDVDIAAETLKRTTARTWRKGTRVNLERSLRIGDELGGHIVTGHIDGVATVVSRRDFDGMAHLEIEAPHEISHFIAAKGSVTLDGTSLTVNEVSGDRFTLLIIPHTLDVTTWGERREGDGLNIEVDLMARYAARLRERG
ncbi:MAG: riboflavin synthase [Methylobacteriaceae bacterium]|jgi:riboflavin synthase|nr:riboflavin synthase [Methylobacteriaceae bacterium]